jgi:hypothetical protein
MDYLHLANSRKTSKIEAYSNELHNISVNYPDFTPGLAYFRWISQKNSCYEVHVTIRFQVTVETRIRLARRAS